MAKMKNTHGNEPAMSLTSEEQLEAILFQFVNLYERWSEDRQLLMKYAMSTTDLLKVFKEEVSSFQASEEQVREAIIKSIHVASTNAVGALANEVGKKALDAVNSVTNKLKNSVDSAEKILQEYQHSIKRSQRKIIGISFLTTIVTSLLVVWLLIPRPTLPLTDEQMDVMHMGYAFNAIYDKLSKEDQDRLTKLIVEAEYPNLGKAIIPAVTTS